MSKVDELIIDVTLKENGFGRLQGRNIVEEMEAIANAEKKVITQSEKTSKSFAKTRKQGFELGKAFRYIGAYIGIKELVKYSDEWTNIGSILKLVTADEKERLKVQQSLFEMAQRTRQEVFDTVDLYRRISVSTESLGLSEQRRLEIVEAINKALIVGGGTSAGNKGALIQLGQGLASGQLRGQELNSILEQSPRLAQMIAEGMGIKTGQLRDIAKQGKLTPEVVLNAIQNQIPKINEEFEKMNITISQSIVVFRNALSKYVNDVNGALNITTTLANGIVLLSNNMKTVVRAIIPLLIMRSKLLTTAFLKTGVAMRYLTKQNFVLGKSFKTFLKLEAIIWLFEQIGKFIKGEDNIFIQVAGLFVQLEKWLTEGLEQMPEKLKAGVDGALQGIYDMLGDIFGGMFGYFGDLWRSITGKKPMFLPDFSKPQVPVAPNTVNNSSNSNRTVNQTFNVTVNEAKQGKSYIDNQMQTLIKQANYDLGYTPMGE